MKTKFKNQRKGAVLMTVLVVSTMMVVIVGAAISLVAHTNYETNKEYRKKQAYFAASTTLETFVTEVTNVSTDAGYTTAEIENEIKRLQNLANGKPTKAITIKKMSPGGGPSGDITDDNRRWNDVEVSLKLEKVGDSNKSLKAISTATYLGQKKTVVAYLSIGDLNKKKSVLNALEMMSGNDTKQYNNIRVYGSTSAPDLSTHEENALYNFTTNNNEFYGDISIYGSMVTGVGMTLHANPYYFEKDYDPSADPDDVEDLPYTPGCTIRISRSLFVINNTPKITSDLVKNMDDKYNVSVNSGKGRNFYNFIDVREAFVIAGSNAQVGDPGTKTPALRGGLKYLDSENNVVDDPTARMVDIYSSLFVIGNAATYVPDVVKWASDSSSNSGSYKDTVSAMQGGNGTNIYGNVYTYPGDEDAEHFNGDIYIVAESCNIYGDIYCSGNIYVKQGAGDNSILDASGTPVGAQYGGIKAFHGTVHFPNDGQSHEIINLDQKSITYTATMQASGQVVFDDWKSEPRAQRPYAMNDLSNPDNEQAITPYYYYPEHLLCEPAISTIWQTYKAMYGTGANVDDGDGTNDFIEKARYRREGSGFVEDPNGGYYYDDTYGYVDLTTKYKQDMQMAQTSNADIGCYYKNENGQAVPVDAISPYHYTSLSYYTAYSNGNTLTYKGYDSSGNLHDKDHDPYTIYNNTYEYTYEDASGVTHTETLQPKGFNPTYVVTGSCVLDTKVKDVLIDLDHAKKNEDGKYDIVIMMNSKERMTDTNGPWRILVKNFEHGADSDDPRFVYFVSDSGVGTTHDEYGESKTPSTYSNFKTGSTFGPGGGKIYLMNLIDYCHSSLQEASPERSLDPTNRGLPAPAYNLTSSGGIFFILTKGMKIEFVQDTIIQANIFMPEAEFQFINNGKGMAIEPKWSTDHNKLEVNILGSLSCGLYDPSSNNNTIVYQRASEQSMLAFVHGVPDEAATESFKLERYASA